ncbi:MAG: DUF421 domain-containing protein [Erysipelotrichaceae bacterium]
MEEYFILIVKCCISYFVIIIALRIMGKREIGELSIFDIVIFLVMSELLALSIQNESNIMLSLVPIATLAFLQVVISYVQLKSKKIRDIIDGKCVILIHNGHINQDIMRKERYTIDDLMLQLRSQGTASPDEVAFAILENSGTLSVLTKKECKVKHPYPLISDGTIDLVSLLEINKDSNWLITSLTSQGVEDYHDVFLCLLKKDGLFVIKKETKSKNKLFHRS